MKGHINKVCNVVVHISVGLDDAPLRPARTAVNTAHTSHLMTVIGVALVLIRRMYAFFVTVDYSVLNNTSCRNVLPCGECTHTSRTTLDRKSFVSAKRSGHLPWAKAVKGTLPQTNGAITAAVVDTWAM